MTSIGSNDLMTSHIYVAQRLAQFPALCFFNLNRPRQTICPPTIMLNTLPAAVPSTQGQIHCREIVPPMHAWWRVLSKLVPEMVQQINKLLFRQQTIQTEAVQIF